MLARQAWRLLTCPDTLCGRVLKAKYFPNKCILYCGVRTGVSYTWRSILHGLDLLRDGIIWRIGGGNSINIWSDPWLPRWSTRKLITPKGHSLLTKVSDLIDPVSGTWDEQLVIDTFWLENAQIILVIPTNPQTED